MKSSPDICTDEEIRLMDREQLRVERQTQHDYLVADRVYCLAGFAALVVSVVTLIFKPIDPTFDSDVWLMIQLIVLVFGLIFSICGPVWYWRHKSCIRRIERQQHRPRSSGTSSKPLRAV